MGVCLAGWEVLPPRRIRLRLDLEPSVGAEPGKVFSRPSGSAKHGNESSGPTLPTPPCLQPGDPHASEGTDMRSRQCERTPGPCE